MTNTELALLIVVVAVGLIFMIFGQHHTHDQGHEEWERLRRQQEAETKRAQSTK